MKTKSLSLFAGIFISMLITLNAMAQQPKYNPPANLTPAQMADQNEGSNYFYRVYTSPNRLRI